MAKARVIETDESDEIQARAEELAQINEEEGGEVFRVTDELRGTQGVELMIIRLTPAENSGYCGMMPVAEFTHDNLKRLYGAGRYKVRIQGPKGFLPGGGNIKIAESLHKTGGSAGGDFMSFLEFQQKQEAERREKHSRLLELAIPSLGAVITAILSRNNSSDMPAILAALKPAPGPTLADLSTAMINLQTLSKPAGETKDPIDTVLRVFEAAQNLSGGDSGGKKGETNWLDVVRDVIKEGPALLKPVMEAAQTAAMQRQQMQQPTVTMAPPSAISAPVIRPVVQTVSTSAPIVAEDSAGIVANNGETDMFALVMPLIKSNLTKVAKWAEDDKNPQTYAEVFFDDLPSNIASYISQDDALKYCNDPNWFQYVVGIEPRLQNFETWCDEFRLELIEFLKPIPEESINGGQPEIPNDGM